MAADISIHAPLAGCDFLRIANAEQYKLFQSTHPLRGATAATPVPFDTFKFQSTHPLRGATKKPGSFAWLFIFQSTHPLRGATASRRRGVMVFQFQSTHPLRGATYIPRSQGGLGIISIHAPLAGCDRSWTDGCSCATDFNPRTPCGVRLPIYLAYTQGSNFNPRTPCGVRLF